MFDAMSELLRVAAAQLSVRAYPDWGAFAAPCEGMAATAAGLGAGLLVYPEMVTHTLLPLLPAASTQAQGRRLDELTPRYRHTAVWTGTEMIVWGGNDANGQSSEGARFNPGTNAWTRTNPVGAPSARGGHSAVWTGSRMLIWGGDNNADGAAYDPSQDTWTPIGSTGAPTARSG